MRFQRRLVFWLLILFAASSARQSFGSLNAPIPFAAPSYHSTEHRSTELSFQPEEREATWALEFKVGIRASWLAGEELMWLAVGQEHPVSLLVSNAGSTEALELRLKATSHEEPLVLAMPLAMITADRQHKLLVRNLGFRIELLCDGVLIDEEWPIGEIPVGSGTTNLTFHEPIEQARFLSRVPSDEDIEAAYGGNAAISERADEVLGPASRDAQYMKPRGWNTNAGDAMPFYHDGTFHLYYLIDRRHHHSKWGLGAHQWAHISSTDLVHWTSYPTALPISHQWEGSICTGSIFFDKGTYYAFYATRMPDRKEHLNMAISADGIRFKKIEPSPFSGPKAPFREGPNRDPNVIRDANGYVMTVTAALEKKADGKEQGTLEELLSSDLKTWSVSVKPFLLPGYSAQPECSDLFLWRGRYYLLFGIDGVTHYKIGKSLHGPWITPELDTLDGLEARVMKTGQFNDDRRILVGWVGYDNFGGNLIFRELVQNEDGTLGTKFPKEMDPSVSMSGGDEHVLLHTEQQSNREYGLVFRGADGRIEKLIAYPAAKTVRWLDPAGHVKNELRNVPDLEDARIEVVRKGDLVDICVSGRRSMIHRLAVPNAGMSLLKQ